MTIEIAKNYGMVDKLLMNCEGSEIDIILKTPIEVFKYFKYILVSFHLFVPELNITEKEYRDCLNKLSVTHRGQMRHKTRFWWEFFRNG